MVQEALGMVETRGLTAAIEAADAMVKAAEVTLIGTDGIKFDHIAVMDRFGQSGLSAELLEEYGVTSANIKAHAKALAAK